MRYLLILLFFSYSYSLYTQEYIDVESYEKEFNYHIERYQDSAKIVVDRLDKIESSKNSVEFYKNYLNGIYHLTKENNLEALYYFKYLDSILSKKDTPLFYLKNKIKLGIALKKLSNDSIDYQSYFKKLLVLSDSIKDTKSNIEIRLNLAKINSKDNLSKAQEIYYSLIDDIKNQKEFDRELAYVYFNLGKFFENSKDFDPNNKLANAKKYYSKAIDHAKKSGLLTLYYNAKLILDVIKPTREEFRDNKGYYIDLYLKSAEEAYEYFNVSKDFLGQLNSLYYLGNSKRWHGDVKGAIDLWERGYNMSLDKGYEPGQKKMSYYITAFSLRLKDYEKAEKYTLLAYNKSKNTKDFKTWKSAELNMASLYMAKKDYKTAIKHYNLYWTLKDSIENREETKKIIELETKYETEKKEQEIKLLTSENALIEKQKKNQRLILLSAITISSLAALFLFFLLKSRRKVNKKLRELDATKSRFFANISHEFRTPLTLISNPIEEGIEDKSLSEERREQFKVAKRNSDRLLTLVNQLLDLSKIDANQLILNIEKTELTPFIAALADSFSYSAQQKEINYIVNIECNTIEAYFDRDAIEKIITNLIANAIKYTPNKEQIKLSCSIVEQQLLFEIKNSGLQLQQNELNSLFNRFYQTNEEHSGSGIGLALVKELVDLHKGSITVNNTEDNWISFSVKLPVDYKSYKNETFVTSAIKDNLTKVEAYKDAIYTQEDDIPINDDKPILLIVEDHTDIRNLVKGLFSDTYRILVATNGEEGIDLAIEHVPDIIISDVMMPIKDGIALTQHLKNDERTSHIPIVLLTAKAGDSNELLGIEEGADDYITKPFNSKILTTKVEKLIESRRLLQERYSQELVLLPKDIAVTNIDEQFLERLQHVLDANLVEPTFSASRFSEAIGMSRMQLHRKLKALTGLTTSEFIRSQRIKLAAELLKKSDVNVSEIGYSVGFNDHSYFTKCFKEIYGCSPTEYISKL